jgi:hypothetical protein
MRNTIYLIIILLSFSSCQYIKKVFTSKEKPIARVFDLYLYPSDVEGIVPKGTSSGDSVLLVQSYVENWIRQSVILKQASDNVEMDKEALEAQLETYRQSLIIYSYEQQLIAQNLDTTVTPLQIKNYYKENSNNFELKQSIIKASYAVIPKNALKIENAKRWFNSSKEKDRNELETYCMQFSPNYNLVDTNWIYLDELTKGIPLNRFSETSILQKNNYINFSDQEFVYLVKIKDFMYKEEVSPLEFEIDNIKNIIINKRKVELINKMENDVYQKARNENDIELYKEE